MQCTNKERVESQSIKRKQQDVFRGSSTELYVSAFTEKDFQSTRGTELLSQPLQPPPRQYKWSTEDWSTKLHQTTNTTSTEAIQIPQSTSTKEGYKSNTNSTSH